MITNILNQSFANFAKTILSSDEEKAVVPPQRQRLDLLADYYTNRVSTNETELVTKYADSLVSGSQPHTPDPRLYMRRDLLGLVQDSYALGIADALVALEDVQFSYKKTDADFAVTPDDKLQRDIARLQRDIQASQNIVRQTKTLDGYTKTLRTLQKQAAELQNTQAIETLGGLSQDLQALKTANTVRGTSKLINQQLQRGGTQQQQAQNTVQQQIATTGQPNTQDYLVKRAIEEKLKYLQNRRDSLAATPPVVLDEDSEFFKWYAQKRLVPIANRYQQGIVDKNTEAKKIVTEYTEKLNNGTITQAAKGDYTDRIVRKILNIEEKATAKGRPIKRVQRVVATELAIAYNVGRLKAYLKAGIQYVTISTSNYSPDVCDYCDKTAKQTEEEPIKISSLLKNAYRNKGFNKDIQPKISDLRYLPNHPYCFCVYLPHPKRDPEDKAESTGIYTDPNSWKFILGAGLGVSLVFLAFALTTGKKIDIPQTIPSVVPKVTLPIIRKDNAPDTIPIDVQVPQPTKLIVPDLRNPISLRLQYQTLLDRAAELPLTQQQRTVLNFDLLEVVRDSNLDEVGKYAKSEVIIAKASTPEAAKNIIDTVATQRGLIKELYFYRFDQIADRFNKTISPQGNINKLQAKVQQVLSKVDGSNIIRTANNIEKTSIDAQLKPISLLRSDLSASLERVSSKTNKKEADLSYINDLEARIDDLDNFATTLRRQKMQLDMIRESVVIVDKAMLQQQIANTQALVDRLVTDSGVLQEAIDNYQDLLEMLLALPKKESDKYKKIQTDLNRRIKSAQGINLKRFTGNIVQFKYYIPYFS
jgi:hypothetical protein